MFSKQDISYPAPTDGRLNNLNAKIEYLFKTRYLFAFYATFAFGCKKS